MVCADICYGKHVVAARGLKMINCCKKDTPLSNDNEFCMLADEFHYNLTGKPTLTRVLFHNLPTMISFPLLNLR